MTREDKELLFKDLCARLPYGVKVQCEDYLFPFDKDHMGIGMLYHDFNGNPLESPKIILSGCYYGEDIKPYLFPMSSMSDEQLPYYITTLKYSEETRGMVETPNSFDWLNKNHYDYRGLIEKGLALDATGLNIY